MNQKEILQKIKAFVFELQKDDSTGHDFWHVNRVVNNAKILSIKENVDGFYIQLLAWLHDVGDYKIHNGIDKTQEMVTLALTPCGFSADFMEEFIQDINMISYKGGFNAKPDKLEVKIVQDADRLDALGAIGIARAFAYGGKKNRLLHNPNFQPEYFKNPTEYQRSEAPTIQHFYDKLLKLKDLMNTSAGKQIAEQRHQYMKTFLAQFYQEWDGKA